MASQQINLFQTKPTLQPVLYIIDRNIRLAAIFFVIIVSVGSVLMGAAYAAFSQKRDTLQREQQALLIEVKRNVAKESMITLIRNRLTAINKIFSTQVSYAPFVDTTMELVQSFTLSSFTMGEKNSVSVVVRVPSLSEATNLLRTLLLMEQKKEITMPVLEAFEMEDQRIQLSLSYTVVL